MEEGVYDDEPPPAPPTQSQASSHFPLEPISGATLFDVEVARREQLHRRGALATGCGEIDRQVLGGRGGGGFERGSVVGISAEGMDTGLLIGLQTIAHSLVASLVGPGPGTTAEQQQQHARQQQQPQSPSAPLRAAVITTLPTPTILPHLRDVIKVQARLKLGGQSPPEAVDAITRQCLQQISISRVFDIEGLWEVLSELEFTAATVAEEDQRPAAGPTMAAKEDEDEEKLEAETADPAPPSDMVLPESSQRSPPPSPSLPPPPAPATKLPPLRIRTEVQDSDEEEDVLLSSSPLSSLRSTPTLSPEAMDELAALSQPTIPNRQPSTSPALPETVGEPKEPSPSPSPAAAQSRQQSPSPVPPTTEQEEPAAASGLPEIILITHISSLFSTLFTGRDKTSAHTTLQLLSSHLRYLSRSAGPLILLLNITSSSSSSSSSTTTNNPAQPPRRPESEQQPPPRPLDPTLRSIFNPPPPSHLGYVATTTANHAHALSRKNKPAFGHTFAQFLDLHLLCTQVPRSREDAKVLFSSTTRQQQQGPVRYAWVVETLVDELGAWEWEEDAAAEGKDSSKGEKTLGKKKWKMVDREQKWGAVEVRNAGCQVVDAFDSMRNTGKMSVEPIRLAAGFGGRRV
ncbi:hypothetical protein PG985_010701 [Apiospora marii]|uniref:Uncharacterized protein n=1 Tax=Apiospora marii TaxID=335849 RepID=A0ABR1T428_9PEZI